MSDKDKDRDDSDKRKRKRKLLILLLLLIILLLGGVFFLMLFRNNVFQTPNSGNRTTVGSVEGGRSQGNSSGTGASSGAGGSSGAGAVQGGLLPAPTNMLPSNGHRIGIEELRKADNIAFSWSGVSGANAYIFTLYQETSNGRRQILQNTLQNRTSWTFDNVAMLDRGTFFWQLEPVNMDRDGTIRQRGRPGENSFIMDIPDLGPVYVEEAGIFYEEED